MSANEAIEVLHKVIEVAALVIELLAVAVIVAGVVVLAVRRGTVRFVYQIHPSGAYKSYKHQLGKTLLMGLDVLVAADVVRTVALEPTLTNIAVLGLLMLIRTFLSWSLTVEMEGRWPWQARSATDAQNGNAQVSPLADDVGKEYDERSRILLVN